MYITRHLENQILKASEQYPVLMVCGQRQVGKSTMLNHIKGENRRYVTLDDMNARRLAENDPALFFETSAFLPSALGKAGSVLPAASLLELWNRAVGFPAENTTGILLLWIVVFLILASVFCKKERRSAA